MQEHQFTGDKVTLSIEDIEVSDKTEVHGDLVFSSVSFTCVVNDLPIPVKANVNQHGANIIRRCIDDDDAVMPLEIYAMLVRAGVNVWLKMVLDVRNKLSEPVTETEMSDMEWADVLEN